MTADIQAVTRFCTNYPYCPTAVARSLGHPLAMLTRLYVEALLADPELADQVWALWNVGMIPDDLAAIA